MVFIGIDPGVNGGLAALNQDGTVILALKIPDTERDQFEVLLTLARGSSTRAWASLEKVSASPGMGVVSAFTFGKGYGAWRMALIAADIPFDEVRPQTWQKVLGCRTGSWEKRATSSTNNKNITKAKAQQLFPSIKVTHAIADALLIAEYGRRVSASRAIDVPASESHAT